jgi:hypothetical protein
LRFFILIEPGRGYLFPSLREKNPDAKINALHSAAPEYTGVAGGPDAVWHPGTGGTLQNFLENEIPDTKAENIKIIEWRPGLAVFGEAYLRLMEETAEFIKRADANARTTGEFGRRWVKNFFKNLNIVEELLCPSPLSLPMVITGAGPGLEEAIPLLREERRKTPFLVLAVSSSAAALEAGGLIPDLIISADGGNWALLHLYECCRRIFGAEKTGGLCAGLAVSLSAAIPSQCAKTPILPISDGSLWQKLVLEGLGIPFITLPQRGTVSASALDLAFYLTGGEIFIAGIDLALKDIQSHARPYSFDRLWEAKERRLNPLYSQSFKRAAGIKAGGSHGIYASWFKGQLEAWPKRLFPLGKNNAVFQSPGASAFGAEQALPEGEAFPAPCKRPGFFRSAPFKKPGNPAGKTASVLKTALAESRYGRILREELGPLLFPGRNSPSLKELEEALLSFTQAGRSYE